MEKSSEIKERLLQVAKNKGISYEKFFEDFGTTYANFKGKSLKSSLRSEVLVDFSTKHPDVDLTWLITGKKQNQEASDIEAFNDEAENYALTSNDSKPIPYYDVEFTSGFDFVENSQANTPTKYISHPDFSQSEFVVRNSGQSMAKVIKHGDSIGLIHLPMWQEFLALGEIYAIVLKDNRRLIKVITKGETKDTYTLISKPTDSKKDEFPPQQIKKSFIKHVFKVDACSSKF